jgi:hypothetical protein
MPDSVVHFGLLPSFGIKLSMSCAKKGEREYVEEQAHGSADDRGAEASGGRTQRGRRSGRSGASKHTLYASKVKYGGMDVSQAQEAKQLRDENTKVADLIWTKKRCSRRSEKTARSS